MPLISAFSDPNFSDEPEKILELVQQKSGVTSVNNQLQASTQVQGGMGAAGTSGSASSGTGASRNEMQNQQQNESLQQGQSEVQSGAQPEQSLGATGRTNENSSSYGGSNQWNGAQMNTSSNSNQLNPTSSSNKEDRIYSEPNETTNSSSGNSQQSP